VALKAKYGREPGAAQPGARNTEDHTRFGPDVAQPGARNTDGQIGRPDGDRSDRATAEVCCVCGKSAREVTLLQCGACTVAPPYCGRTCQRADWATHKSVCKANKKT
jgi:hypothetical protein